MNTEQIKNALNALVGLYKEMEQEYSLDLTESVKRASAVLTDIDEAMAKAEHREAYLDRVLFN